MKNHFARTGVDPDLADASMDTALDSVSTEHGSELESDVAAARDILATPLGRVQYQRTHLQYRALAEALDTLDHPIATDSHRWRERLVEFEPDVGSGLDS